MSTSIKPKLRKKKQPVIATDRTLGKIRIFGSPSKTSVVFEIPGAALNLGLWRARGTTHGPPLDHGRAQDAWLRDARAAGPSEQGSVGNGGTTHGPRHYYRPYSFSTTRTRPSKERRPSFRGPKCHRTYVTQTTRTLCTNSSGIATTATTHGSSTPRFV